MVVSCCLNEEIRKRWRDALKRLVGQGLVAISDSDGVREHLQNNPDDLVLLHLQSLGSGSLSFVAGLVKSFPRAKIMVFSNTPNDEEGIAVLKAGAMGYCNTYIKPGLLRKAVSGVRDDQVWVGHELLHHLMARLPAAPLPPGTTDKLERLTPREREVAMRVAEGDSNQTIAREFDIQERTVKAYVGRVFGKMGVTDRLQLALLVRGIPALRKDPRVRAKLHAELSSVPG